MKLLLIPMTILSGAPALPILIDRIVRLDNSFRTPGQQSRMQSVRSDNISRKPRSDGCFPENPQNSSQCWEERENVISKLILELSHSSIGCRGVVVASLAGHPHVQESSRESPPTTAARSRLPGFTGPVLHRGSVSVGLWVLKLRNLMRAHNGVVVKITTTGPDGVIRRYFCLPGQCLPT